VNTVATAAKLAIVPEPAEALSAAEEYARLSGEEIYAASQETSKKFNGMVLAKAVVLVQCRVKCMNLTDLALLLDVGRVTVYRWARGLPCSESLFRRALRELALLLADEGSRK
jgi:hypothetical protein